jgi:hypothetical protein
MINQNYLIYDLTTSIGRHVALRGVPMIFIRSYGWNNTSDVDKINESRELYKGVLPLDLWMEMDRSEYNLIELESLDGVVDFLGDSFPESQASCTEPSQYVFYALYNDQGQIIESNE